MSPRTKRILITSRSLAVLRVLRDAALEHDKRLKEWKDKGLLFGPHDTIPSRADIRDEIARLYEPEIPNSPSTVIRCEPKLSEAKLAERVALEDGSNDTKLVLTTFGFAVVHTMEQHFGPDHEDWDELRVQVEEEPPEEITVFLRSSGYQLCHIKQGEEGVIVETVKTEKEVLQPLGK